MRRAIPVSEIVFSLYPYKTTKETQAETKTGK